MNNQVVIAGFSKNPERYSNMAFAILKEYGYDVFPVNPAGGEYEGCPILKNLDEAPRSPGTLTVYVNPSISDTMADSILKLKPQRIIFNPGTENQALAELCRKSGIQVIEACTLVLLKT